MTDAVLYRAGRGYAVVTGHLVVLLDEASAARAGELWVALAEAPTVETAVDALTRGGLRGLPSFGLAGLENGVARLLVRGGVVARLGATRQEEVSAGAVTTWRETTLPGPQPVELSLEQDLPSGEPLPLRAGVVRAARVTWTPTATEPPAAQLDAEAQDSSPVADATPSWALITEPSPEPDLDFSRTIDPRMEGSEPEAQPELEPEAQAEPEPEPEGLLEPEPAAVDLDVIPVQPGVYDDLFGATIHRSVEDAAVRDDAPGAIVLPSVPNDDADVDLAPDHPADGPEQESASLETIIGADGGLGFSLPAAPDEPVEPPVPVPSDDGGLIDGFPGAGPAAPAVPPPGTPPVAALLEEIQGDHDGMTIARGALRPTGASAEDGLEHVTSVLCPDSHLNPPHAASCRVCGMPVPPQAALSRPQTPLARLQLDDGRALPLDLPVLVGRNPRPSGAVGGQPPQLLTVPSAGQDVSRTHVEVRVEDWQILVTDLDSRNGTLVLLPGRDPQRLHPRRPLVVPTGTRVVLADDVAFTVQAR